MSRCVWRSGTIVAVIVGIAGVLAGCNKDTSEANAGATAPGPEAQKTDAIVRQAGGDWSRLSDSDRTTLIHDLGKGNERTAQMKFQGRWSRLSHSNGPPNPRAMMPGPPH